MNKNINEKDKKEILNTNGKGYFAFSEEDKKHYSDCAVHNEPAYPNGKCNCGGIPSPSVEEDWEEKYERNFNKTFGFGIWRKLEHAEGEDVMTSDVLEYHRKYIRSLLFHVRPEAYGKGFADGRNAPSESLERVIAEAIAKERERWVKLAEGIISKHNARILNQFQLQGTKDMPMIAYDERVCLVPAMEIATKDTLSSLLEESTKDI